MGQRILFADDDQVTVESLTPLLQDEGYEVVTAADGEEALAILTERPVDLVLLDLRMPKRSGVEVLRWMREERQLTTPVIVLSHVLEWEKERQQLQPLLQRYGECRQFLKPEGPETLLRAVAEALHPTPTTDR